MSDDEDPGFFRRRILPWFHFPGTDSDDKDYYTEEMEHHFGHIDEIWHHFDLFDGGWHEIQNRVDWYESPKVPRIYKDHVYIFKQNMDMGRPDEIYYEENVDSRSFKSTIHKEGDLPSGRGKLRIESTISTKTPPSGENDFAFVEYFVATKLKYDMPKGVQKLPRILAHPMNRFFKWAFMMYMGHHMVDYDGEYAREKTTEYFQYLRKYHGEEPTQTKTRQAEFKPVPEEGIFFQ